MKIFVVGESINYADFIEDAKLVDSQEEADVVLFTGGEDVDPSIYGCEKHFSTYSNKKRDLKEKKVFNTIKHSQLCVGICRGSQFLCAMNGGILVQDSTGHALWGTHGITNGDMEYQITSTHHQMQFPYYLKPSEYDVLFRSTETRSDYYEGDGIQGRELQKHGEPEVVLYHTENHPKCLAIQGHPEMIPESPVAKMLSSLIHKLVKEINNDN